MQAIQTKYLPCTNTKPSRIKAWCAAGSVTIGYPHELSGQAVHRAAAEKLVAKLNWTPAHGKAYGPLVGGGLPNGDHCFVMLNDFAHE